MCAARHAATLVGDVLGPAALPPGVVAGLRRRALAKGETVFRQGDRTRALFVLEEGVVDLVRHSPDGRQLLVFSAGAGESFAEAALFAETYHCDAIARTRCRIVEVPRQALRAALRRDPAVAERLLARLARQVHDLRQRLELRNIRNARERLWQHLLLAAGGSRTVVLERPLKATAAEIGLTHEALYRALAALEAAGRIRRRRRRIELRDDGA